MYTKNINTRSEKSYDQHTQLAARYILANPKIFSSKFALLPKIEQLVREHESTQNIPRQLFLGKIALYAPQVLNEGNAAGEEEWIYHCSIANRRSDITAVNTTVFLKDIEYPDGTIIPSPDTSLLKWVGITGGYSRAISSAGRASFDLLCISKTNPTRVYLHSGNFNSSKDPALEKCGTYILRYNVLSEGFHLLEFRVKLTLTGNIKTTTLEVESSGSGTFNKI